MGRKRDIEMVGREHVNLDTFAKVVTLLESGSLYGDNPEAAQIIKIANRAQQRILRRYDAAIAVALAPTTDTAGGGE